MIRCAVVGSGNIGSDLVAKLRRSAVLEPTLLVGIDPASDGLRRAREMGIATAADGVEAILDNADRFDVVFEATSAEVHKAHADLYQAAGILAFDLTPAAVGPYIVPAVNLSATRRSPNLNLVTCGGQATIPIVAALSALGEVPYAEIVATIASKAAGPGTRANVDEFTETTADALVKVGGAVAAKAIIILNPAEPPLIMRNSVFAAVDAAVGAAEIVASVEQMVEDVREYVPGYRLVMPVQVDPDGGPAGTTKVSVIVEVVGGGDYLPVYAGNLDIITAAAVAAAERLAPAAPARPESHDALIQKVR